MKIAMFDTHRYDRESFDAANADGAHTLRFLEPRLTVDTAALAAGSDVVCSFVNDRVDAATLERLAGAGTRLVTAHQAFLTREALASIARVTLASVTAFERGEPLVNAVHARAARLPGEG